MTDEVQQPIQSEQPQAPQPAPEAPRERMYTESELEARLAAVRSDFSKRNRSAVEETKAEYEARIAELQQQQSEGERLRRDALNKAGRSRLEQIKAKRIAATSKPAPVNTPAPYPARATAPGSSSPTPTGYNEYVSAVERGDARAMRKISDKNPEVLEYIRRYG